jgi:hypothetical protein
VAWTRARIADKSRLAERDIYVRRVTRGWSYPDPGKIRVTAAPVDEGDPAMSAGKTGRAILAYEAVQPGGGVLIRYRLLLEGEDKSGPRVVHTRRWSDTEMSLVFDEPVEPESASRAENYTIEGLAVKSAAWDEDPRTLGREVRLVTGPLERGRKYVVRVKGVKDRSERGNAADGRDFSFVAKPGTSARGEFIEKWLTVGPFPHSWKTAYVDVKRVRPSDGQAVEVRPAAELEALMKDALGEERWARERHAEKFAERFGGGRKWKAAKSRGGAILPLSREYGELVFATAYAHVYVYSPVSRSALLRLDATDAHRAWVNGRQVSFDDRMKTGRGLHDYTNGAKLRLSAGWNRLLVQQSNRFGRWQLAAQLTDPEGRPLGDLTWSVDGSRLPVAGTR